MKYFKRYLILLIVSSLLCSLLSGCGQSTPPDMPVLHPCSITVKIKGKPLDGVAIQLLAVDQSKWFATGFTDKSGVANVQTLAEFSGAAIGEYIVTATKEVADPNWTPNPNKPEDGAPIISFINYKYANKDTSPLHCTVKEGLNQFEFEVISLMNKKRINNFL
ncbi:MAG: lipoprotein [Planctomycetaceae bacterium]|jgi:hypothetical protein|nr:lipoprotein [Planctomycetaceae bacterium]